MAELSLSRLEDELRQPTGSLAGLEREELVQLHEENNLLLRLAKHRAGVEADRMRRALAVAGKCTGTMI
jgi:hypothetical protein